MLAKRILYGLLAFVTVLALYVTNMWVNETEADIRRLLDARNNIVMPEVSVDLSDSNMTELYAHTSKYAVHIRAKNGWQGSGVIIAPSIVLTAKHIAEDSNGLTITIADGNEYKSIGYICDPNYDSALVFFDPRKPFDHVVELGSDPVVGQKVFMIGSPYGYELFNTVANGIVSGVNRERWVWNDCITLDVLGDPGCSGGPVFDMAGRVVGIVVGTYSRYGNGTVAVPISQCYEKK